MDAPAPPVTDQQLLRSLPVAVVFTDSTGLVVAASDRVQEVVGREPSGLVGSAVADLFPDPVSAEVTRLIQRWSVDGESPHDGRILRLPVLQRTGRDEVMGVRIHLSDDGFAIALLDLRSSGDALRAVLLDFVSADAVTHEVLLRRCRRGGRRVRLGWSHCVGSRSRRRRVAGRDGVASHRGPGDRDRRRPGPAGTPSLHWPGDATTS